MLHNPLTSLLWANCGSGVVVQLVNGNDSHVPMKLKIQPFAIGREVTYAITVSHA